MLKTIARTCNTDTIYLKLIQTESDLNILNHSFYYLRIKWICLKSQRCVCFRLTLHLCLEELNERLCEGNNPFVHDVVTLLHCVLIV